MIFAKQFEYDSDILDYTYDAISLGDYVLFYKPKGNGYVEFAVMDTAKAWRFVDNTTERMIQRIVCTGEILRDCDGIRHLWWYPEFEGDTYKVGYDYYPCMDEHLTALKLMSELTKRVCTHEGQFGEN